MKLVDRLVAVSAVLAAALVTGDADAQPPPVVCVEAARYRSNLERAEARMLDWPALGRYRDANAAVGAPARGERRVVFMGDSITDNWSKDELAQAHGIQVVLASVLPVSDHERDERGRPRLQTHRRPPSRILELNRWIKQHAGAGGHVYLDYFAAMVDAGGRLRRELSDDGPAPGRRRLPRDGSAGRAGHPRRARASAAALSDRPGYLHSYLGKPEHLPDLHLWSLPNDPALPHVCPLLSLVRQALSLKSRPASQYLPSLQSPSDLQTHTPLTPSMSLHLPSLQASSE